MAETAHNADVSVQFKRLIVEALAVAVTGGITEWRAAGRPVETGDRRSGQFIPAKP